MRLGKLLVVKVHNNLVIAGPQQSYAIKLTAAKIKELITLLKKFKPEK